MRRAWIGLTLLVGGRAWAHPLQITGVVVHVERASTTVSVMVHLPLLGGADPAVAVPPRLHIRLDGREFHAESATVENNAANDTATWTGTEGRGAQAVAVESPVFPERADDTTAVLVYRSERLVGRMALTPAHPAAEVGESSWRIARRFVEMGVLHILSGPDHILFVLGLILAGGTVRQLLGLLTAFTLAHSVTLTLTALGIASLAPRFVEPVIALSIVAVALENLSSRRRDYWLRVGLAFGFGFFHGFGFAGALTEAGLPREAIGWSLASFNIGVELGQGCILLAALPILAAIGRRGVEARARFTRYASVGIAAAGVFWLVERVRLLWFGGG